MLGSRASSVSPTRTTKAGRFCCRTSRLPGTRPNTASALRREACVQFRQTSSLVSPSARSGKGIESLRAGAGRGRWNNRCNNPIDSGFSGNSYWQFGQRTRLQKEPSGQPCAHAVSFFWNSNPHSEQCKYWGRFVFMSESEEASPMVHQSAHEERERENEQGDDRRRLLAQFA